MISLFKITNSLSKLNIRLPEIFLKEEVVRYLTESDERIVETPLIIKSIPLDRKRILDIGCRYSNLSMHLASLGHDVYGIDINNYKRRHPNFHFRKADILKSKYPNNFFDIVVSLSTIEHIGFGRYGDKKDIHGDVKAVNEAYRIIKHGGTFLITLPFGKPIDTEWYRVYDMKRVRSLLIRFKIVGKFVFKEKDSYWTPTTIKDAEMFDSSKKPVGVIIVKVSKV